MHNAINYAKLILFLGFGFHSSNVDLISRATGGFHTTTVLGTVKGIHRSNHDLIESRLRQNLKSPDTVVQ
jgi:hypothetical protein